MNKLCEICKEVCECANIDSIKGMSEDREVDDILESLKPKKKKIKSGRKGKRVELGVVKDLNERFATILAQNPDWGAFSRSVGSGNRWGQKVTLSKAAKDTYSGDIVCPECFRFVLESKGGYNDIDLCSAFLSGHRELDGFLKQVSDDATRSGRKPLLFWKKDRKPRLVFLRTRDLPEKHKGGKQFEFKMTYREWTAISYTALASFEDEFFFGSSVI